MANRSTIQRCLVLYCTIQSALADGSIPGCIIEAYPVTDEAALKDQGPLNIRSLASSMEPVWQQGAEITNSTWPRNNVQRALHSNITTPETDIVQALDGIPVYRSNMLDFRKFNYERCKKIQGGRNGGKASNVIKIQLRLWPGGPIFDYSFEVDPENSKAFRGRRLSSDTGEWQIGELNMVVNKFGELAG